MFLTDDWLRPVLKRSWVGHGICYFEISGDLCPRVSSSVWKTSEIGTDSISVNYSKLPTICWELPLVNVYHSHDLFEFVKCDWHSFFGTGRFLRASVPGVQAGVSRGGYSSRPCHWNENDSLKIKMADSVKHRVPVFKHYYIKFLSIRSM